jgi:hypothetical protein
MPSVPTPVELHGGYMSKVFFQPHLRSDELSVIELNAGSYVIQTRALAVWSF